MGKGTHQDIKSAPEQQYCIQGCQSSLIGKRMNKLHAPDMRVNKTL